MFLDQASKLRMLWVRGALPSIARMRMGYVDRAWVFGPIKAKKRRSHRDRLSPRGPSRYFLTAPGPP